MKIAEMKTFADTVNYEFEKILCVSANTKKNDLNEVFKSFDVLHFDSVIITKVDETTSIGNVINVAEKYHKPISYYTTGQEVPSDIEVAESSKLVELMITENMENSL
jgi:flagellar biosynthesis protein FlhF